MSDIRLGIDIGGSGIKGALIDVTTGQVVSERVRVATPQPATPESVASSVAQLVGGLGYQGDVGVGFPGVVRDGIVYSAGNVDKSWFGANAREILGAATGRNISVVNDADAAALCEARFGAASGVKGLVIVLTFGTGIGSGFLFDGRLIPNIEMGAIELEGYVPAELHFAAAARKRDSLSWEEWGARANRFLTHIDRICTPELLIAGGGIVRKWNLWSEQIDNTLRVVPAEAENNAGLIGAATLVA